MGQYRKKPVVISAHQWDGDLNALCDGVGVSWAYRNLNENSLGQLEIPTLEGIMLADKGDWIIEGVKGELYPCKPDIFAETYEAETTTVREPEPTDAQIAEQFQISADAFKEYPAHVRLLGLAATRLSRRPAEGGVEGLKELVAKTMQQTITETNQRWNLTDAMALTVADAILALVSPATTRAAAPSQPALEKSGAPDYGELVVEEWERGFVQLFAVNQHNALVRAYRHVLAMYDALVAQKEDYRAQLAAKSAATRAAALEEVAKWCREEEHQLNTLAGERIFTETPQLAARADQMRSVAAHCRRLAQGEGGE